MKKVTIIFLIVFTYSIATAANSYIIMPSQLVVSTPISTNVSCFGFCDGTASVIASGGTTPYSYSWNSTPIQSTAKAIGLCAGNYTCTVTDSSGYTSSASVVILQPTPLTVAITGVTSICPRASTTLTTSGGGTYNWSTGTSNLSITVAPITTTTYSVTVTNIGCTGSASIQITVLPSIVLNINIMDATCGNFDGSATVSVSGSTSPYKYNWNPTGKTAATATNLSTGTYTVTVTDFNSCPTSKQITITCANGIQEKFSTNENINIYPNPSDGNIVLKYLITHNGEGIIKIYDLTGKLIKEYKLNSNSNNLTLNTNLNNGIYSYQVIVNNKTVKTDKLIIIKQ